MAGERPDWSTIPLRECGQWYSGGTPSTSIPEYWDGDIPWITASSLHSFRITDSERRVTMLGVDNGTRMVPANTILFVVRGMSLKSEFRVGISMRPVTFGQDCKAIVPRKDMAPLFLANVLRAKAPEILEIVDEASHGTGRLQTDALGQLAIPVPPLTEQQAIACILGALDDKIELNRRMNRTLEAMARAIFQSWFVDFDPVRAKLAGRQPPGLNPKLAALFPDAFEDSELGEIPKGWRVATLGDVCQLAYGKARKADERVPGHVAVMGSNGQVGWHNVSLVSGPGVVVGRKGNPGIITWVDSPFFPIDTTFYVVPRRDSIPLTYLHDALVHLDLPRFSADSAVPGLNRNIAYMSNVVVPRPELLSAFDLRIKTVRRRMEATNKENRTLATLRDALLPKLISGELRVPDAERIVGRCT